MRNSFWKPSHVISMLIVGGMLVFGVASTAFSADRSLMSSAAAVEMAGS